MRNRSVLSRSSLLMSRSHDVSTTGAVEAVNKLEPIQDTVQHRKMQVGKGGLPPLVRHAQH